MSHTLALRRFWFSPKLKFTSDVVVGLTLAGTAAYSANAFNTPETGYFLCVNSKTKIVTYPAKQNCPTGTTRLILGAQGPQGEIGPSSESVSLYLY